MTSAPASTTWELSKTMTITHPTRSVVPCAVTWGFNQPDARYAPIERLGATTDEASTPADRAIAALARIKQARKDAEAAALSEWLLS